MNKYVNIMNKLPIYNILDTLLSQLKISKNIIIEAATGAGKTTRIPLALLNANWLLDKKIIMLEPRRLAARAAANHMANILGERVGETVGYHIRMDRKIGKNTIIQVVTEGILTKILQDDPALEDIGAIIFDEFHERSLNADLALALSIDCQIGLRPDLRLLVMSATLNGAMVAKILDDAPIITSKGRSHAVEVKYFPKPMANKLCQETVAAIELALRQEKGSILTFLPGEGEIKQVERLLRSNITRQQNNDNIIIAPLYGMMATKAQDLALKPAAIGMRKVVLTTAIAETSLTIDGIRVVIDAGLSRVAKFNMANGMTKLETISVAKSAADQRSGRAGRLQSGVCYRLWSKAAHVGLKDYPDPEILNADLASLALNLALWGVKSPNDLKWLTPPPQVRYDKAVLLLKNMAAIGQDGLITNHGKKMAKISIHPRLAHMILKAKSNGHGYLACLIAALLTEGDFINLKGDQGDIDISLRLELMINPHHASKYGDGLRKSILMRAIKAAKSWCQNLDIDSNFKNNNKLNFQMAGVVLALAYPDHIAKSRDAMGGRYLLTNGSGAMVNPLDKLANNQYLVAANIGGHGVDSNQ